MPEGLLNDVKNYLKITWDDEATDSTLEGIITRGMARLNDIAGMPLDFTEEALQRSLLFDYCRYAYNNALEVFEINFQNELLSLHIKSIVEAEV